jgi:predicted P-loop ATPase
MEAIGAPFYVSMSGRNLDLSKSDSHSVLNGTAMAEIPENILARKNDSETLKGYFSQKTSKVRLPYGHHHIELKRRNIFSITLNPDADKTHLSDPTGDTRYPIEYGLKPIDWKLMKALRQIRDHCLPKQSLLIVMQENVA